MSNTMSKPTHLEFVLEVTEFPVRLQHPNTKKWSHYILRETDGTKRDAHLTNLNARMKLDKKGRVTGVSTFEALQAELIQKCLFEVDVKDEKKFLKDVEYVENSEKEVPLKLIQSWRSSVLDALHKKCKEICALEDEKDEDEDGEDEEDSTSEKKAKND